MSTSKSQNWNRDAELMRVQGEFSPSLQLIRLALLIIFNRCWVCPAHLIEINPHLGAIFNIVMLSVQSWNQFNLKKIIVILCNCVQKLIPNSWTGFESGFLVPNSHSFPIDVNQDHLLYVWTAQGISTHISRSCELFLSAATSCRI